MNTITVTTRHRRLLHVFNGIIGILLLLAILVLMRDVLTVAYQKTGKASLPRYTGPGSNAPTFQENEIIMKNNPFGLPPASLTPLSVSQGQPAARSDMTLIGTIAGRQKRGFAIFSDSGGRQEVYRVGDTIPGVGRLQGVESDKVSVKSADRLLEIPLADIVKITEVSPSQRGPRTSEFVRSIGGGTYIVDQRKVQDAIENPNQLMTDARLQPNFRDGRQEGFTLREVKQGGIYQSLGLQNGDVLLRINDYTITNPENALQAFTALRGMDRIQLDVLRDSAKMTLTYQIR